MNEDRLAITIITGLIVFVIIMGFIAVSGGIFIAIGYIFSLILPLSFFHSTLLCICASFVSVFTIHSITNYDDKQKVKYQIEDDYEEEEDEEEDDDIENEVKKSLTVINAKKVGRNENCSCGSGRKYKYCCGR